MKYLFQKDGRQTMLTPLKLYGEINDLLKISRDSRLENVGEIFVDLSNMEWINLTSLVELILYIEKWIIKGMCVTVALPNYSILAKEDKAVKEKGLPRTIFESKSKRRKNVYEWLLKLGLVEILSFNHLENESKVRLFDNYDHQLFEDSQKNESGTISLINPLSEHINKKFPDRLPFLKWIKISEIISENGIISSQFIEGLKTCLRKSTLNEDIVIDICERIIIELMKNVKEHSSKDTFLFGIAKNPFFNYEKVLSDYEDESSNKDKISIKYYSHPCFLGKQYLFDEFLFYREIFNEELMIEIALGEIGDGIPCTLRKNIEYIDKPDNDLLKISFGKWSTRYEYKGADDYIKRGIRGLYHVRRIITKYDGFIAIRNGNNYVGFNDLVKKEVNNQKFNKEYAPLLKEHVDLINAEGKSFRYNFKLDEIIKNNVIPDFKGTLFTIKLFPERVHKLSYKFFPRKKSKNEDEPINEKIAIESLPIFRIPVDLDNFQNTIEQIGKESKNNSNALFLISIKWRIIHNSSEKFQYESKTREFLAGLSEMRHPNIHFVYGLPIVDGLITAYGDNYLDNIISSVNANIERKVEEEESEQNYSYDKKKYFDPVLILSPTNKVFWIGVVGANNKERSDFLEELTKDEIGKKIHSIKKDLMIFVNSDKNLFKQYNGRVILNVNKNAPIDYLGSKFSLKIDEIEKQFNKDFKATLTPNLVLTKGWFPIEEISEHINEAILAFYSLWIENRTNILIKHFPKHPDWATINQIDLNRYQIESNLDEIQKKLLQKKIKILVESETDKELGERFLQLLEISESHNYLKVLSDEFDYKKPRRLPLFDNSDIVIILCSLVSSGETLRKMVKSVLRSNATPLAVLSLIDISCSPHRENIVNVWGNDVFYFSRFKDNRLYISKKNNIKSIEYRGPKWSVEEKPSKAEDGYKIKETLRNMIVNSGALHFNHIGKPNARHFTFYFNAHRFLTFENYDFNFIADLWEKTYQAKNDISDDNVLFQNFIWQMFIRKKMLDSIKDCSSLKNSVIWYPDSDYIKGYQKQGEEIAKIIRHGLKRDNDIDLKIQPIPRESEVKANVNPDSTIFIADWGSLTLETIEKLVFKAHIAFVNSVKSLDNTEELGEYISSDNKILNNIIVCIFINQLPSSKYEYVKRIAGINKKNISVTILKRLGDDEVIENENLLSRIEVISKEIEILSNLNIVFFNDFPLSCFESDYECDVCAVLRDLNDFSFPGTALNNYLGSRKKALSIRTREDTSKKPFDFYSDLENEIHLYSKCIMKMFEFKTLLMLALNSTFYRHMVQQKFLNVLNSIVNSFSEVNSPKTNTRIWDLLVDDAKEILMDQTNLLSVKDHESDIDINKPDSEINSIIYFLSVETSWVQKAPLSFEEIRKILKVITKAIIFNENMIIANERGDKNFDAVRIKYAAITVLRIVDKSDFMEHLFDIVQAAQNYNFYSNSILENIVFHTHTFISKEYHEQHKDLDGLIKNLDSLNKLEFENSETSSLVKESVFTLKRAVSNLIIKGEIRSLSKLELIKKCKTDIEMGNVRIDYKHPVLIQNIRDLELKTKNIPEYFKKVYYSHWNYISNFIRNIIGLPFKELHDLLNIGWANSFGSYYLSSYLSTYSIGYNDPFSLNISQIKDTNFKCFEDDLFLNEYIVEYNRIVELFISHPKYNKKSSVVYEILNAINGNLKDAFEYAKDRYSGSSLFSEINGIYDVTVFYPQVLLNSLFNHLFQNGKEKAISGKSPKMTINVETNDPSSSQIVLSIEYDNTDREINKGDGTGLQEHINNLSKFNGELIDNRENTDEKFKVTIKFIKYD